MVPDWRTINADGKAAYLRRLEPVHSHDALVHWNIYNRLTVREIMGGRRDAIDILCISQYVRTPFFSRRPRDYETHRVVNPRLRSTMYHLGILISQCFIDELFLFIRVLFVESRIVLQTISGHVCFKLRNLLSESLETPWNSFFKM